MWACTMPSFPWKTAASPVGLPWDGGEEAGHCLCPSCSVTVGDLTARDKIRVNKGTELFPKPVLINCTEMYSSREATAQPGLLLCSADMPFSSRRCPRSVPQQRLDASIPPSPQIPPQPFTENNFSDDGGVGGHPERGPCSFSKIPHHSLLPFSISTYASPSA